MYCAEKHSLRLVFLAVLFGLAATGSNIHAQKATVGIKPISLLSFSGEARLNGIYREKERSRFDYFDYQKSANLSGGLMLRASTAILHRNFLILDLDGAFMPETRRDRYIIIPDQSEVRTLKKIGATAHFFQNRIVNFTLFGHYDQSYSTRENLTNIRTTGMHWGGNLGCINKILPVTVDLQSHRWKEEEIPSGRIFNHDQKTFSTRTYKSFTKHDRSELRFSHDELENINQDAFRVGNINNNLNFTNHLDLDSARRYNFNTLIDNFNQHGTSNLNRFQAGESMSFQLPAQLFMQGNYNFYNLLQESHRLLHHSVYSGLEHHLFKSLVSRINIEYNNLKNTAFREVNSKTGFQFSYSKNVRNGNIQVNYRYDRYGMDHTADSLDMVLSNEQYVLSDTKITLLRLPDVDESSILIKDLTGTFFYQKDLDYILVNRGKYLEIRRIPGGTIANESPVLIDYRATQPGSYHYNAHMHTLTSGLYLFSNKLSVTYRFSTQDYFNLVSTDFVTLNYFTQHLAGLRLDFGWVSGGAEYEDYRSSIMPYRMWRYYFSFQRNFGNRLTAMLNGNMQNYVMLDEPQPKYQDYLDVTGKISWDMIRSTRINFDLMWRRQAGRGIDLNLLTSRLEVVSTFNKLFVTLGTEIYRRNYIGEKINFKGAYVKIVRKF